jgi:hypothetical protein
VSKKTNALKHARLTKKPRRLAHKAKGKRPNPAFSMSEKGMFNVAVDFMLMDLIRTSGLRDAIVTALLKAPEKPEEPEETVQ